VPRYYFGDRCSAPAHNLGPIVEARLVVNARFQSLNCSIGRDILIEIVIVIATFVVVIGCLFIMIKGGILGVLMALAIVSGIRFLCAFIRWHK